MIDQTNNTITPDHTKPKKKTLVQISGELITLILTGEREKIEEAFFVAKSLNIELTYVLSHWKDQIGDITVDNLVTYFSIKRFIKTKKIPTITIEKYKVLKKLHWPDLPLGTYPPHQYPWSMSDEKSLLLYISTSFQNKKSFKRWLAENDVPTDSHELNHYIDWLISFKDFKYGTIQTLEDAIESSTNEILFLFIINVLNRTLIWYSPDCHWQSGLDHALSLATNSFKKWYHKTPVSNDEIRLFKNEIETFLGDDGWGDVGYLCCSAVWTDYLYCFYNTLLATNAIITNQASGLKDQLKQLSYQVYYNLQKTLDILWSYLEESPRDNCIESFNYQWEGIKEQICKDEKRWCLNLIMALTENKTPDNYICKWSSGSRN